MYRPKDQFARVQTLCCSASPEKSALNAKGDQGEGGGLTCAHNDSFKFSKAGGPEQEYDEKKVEDLKEGLLEALKNATNIRNLKSEETITVCVFGGASAGARKARTVRALPKPEPDAPEEELFVSIRDDGVSARGTIMTIRVKKSDADAFAKGELNADEFRKRASITTYAGDTSGWGGGSVFGLAAP